MHNPATYFAALPCSVYHVDNPAAARVHEPRIGDVTTMEKDENMGPGSGAPPDAPKPKRRAKPRRT